MKSETWNIIWLASWLASWFGTSACSNVRKDFSSMCFSDTFLCSNVHLSLFFFLVEARVHRLFSFLVSPVVYRPYDTFPRKITLFHLPLLFAGFSYNDFFFLISHSYSANWPSWPLDGAIFFSSIQTAHKMNPRRGCIHPQEVFQ